MEEIISLVEYGVVGIAIALIVLIFCLVDRFFRFAKHQEDSFKNTIDNHMNEQAKLNRDQLEMNKSLKSTVDELLTFLKYHNTSDKK